MDVIYIGGFPYVMDDLLPMKDFFDDRFIDLYWMWRYVTGYPPFYHHSYGSEI